MEGGDALGMIAEVRIAMAGFAGFVGVPKDKRPALAEAASGALGPEFDVALESTPNGTHAEQPTAARTPEECRRLQSARQGRLHSFCRAPPTRNQLPS